MLDGVIGDADAGQAQEHWPRPVVRCATPMHGRSERQVIGWREWVGLPELGVERIKAKVDTGARSSALHAYDVRVVRHGARLLVRFRVLPFQRSEREAVEAEATLLEYRSIRNSGGLVERRPVIQTAVRIGELSVPIELTLTSRDAMGFRMLLGRQAVRDAFIVDPGRSFLQGRRRKRRATDPSATVKY